MWMETLLILTLSTSCLLIAGIPVMFVWAAAAWLRHRNLAPLVVLSSIACGFAIGLAVAWSYVVIHGGWHLSFTETVYACFRADIYGRAMEDAAEDYFLFTLFLGDIGAILAGAAGWLSARRLRRMAWSD